MASNVFEQIKNQSNIVDVIGRRINLKKMGGEWVGICPFHDDHNPSLFVSARKQLYKCFSCGAGGDVIKFVMEYDKLSLKDAMKSIASLYNIVLPETFSFRQAEKIDRFLDMKTINAWAADLYQNYLFVAKGGKPGRDYLKSRGIPKAALDAFKIGYAPNDNSSFLIRWVTRDPRIRNLSWKKSSLFFSRYSELRDFFRDRILFPIYSEKGEVLGFGGRSIGDQEPKYLNVRESPWFQKREILYGLKESYARMIQTKQVYVVEGYLDVMACYLAGIPAVAPLGTALTREQLIKLKRYVDKVNLFFDGDASGKKAAWRSAQDLVALSMDGKVFLLDQGDPFDFIKNNSSQAVKDFLSTRGVNVYSYLVNEASRNRDRWSPVEKKEALELLVPIYHSISDSLVKKNFSDLIAEAFSLDWEKYLRDLPPANRYSPTKTQVMSSSKDSENSRDSGKSSANLIKKERTFVFFLCEHPEFVSSARPVIPVEKLEDNLSRYIYRKLLTMKEGIGFQKILEMFRKDGQDRVADFITDQLLKKEYLHAKSTDEAQPDGAGKVLDSEVQARSKKIEDDFNTRLVILKREQLKKKKTFLNDQITKAREEGQEEEERKLYEAYTALKVEEDNLKKYLEKI